MTPAEQIRRVWCGLYGMDDAEIEDNVRNNPPLDEAEEQRQLDALRELQETAE